MRRHLIYKQPLLYRMTSFATVNTQQLFKVIKDLWDTVEFLGRECAGLAANQIGEDVSVCVISHNKLVLVNPKITSGFGLQPSLESCYSLPGYAAIVPRKKMVTVVYTNAVGEPKTLTVKDIRQAAVIQHEVDHLNGILLEDYVIGRKNRSGGILMEMENKNNDTYINWQSEHSELLKASKL
jgi:peptide deformylase